MSDAILEKISTWVSAGGRLIAIGDALGALQERKGFALTRFANEDDKKNLSKRGANYFYGSMFLAIVCVILAYGIYIL